MSNQPVNNQGFTVKDSDIVSNNYIYKPEDLKEFISSSEKWRLDAVKTYEVSLIQLDNYASKFIAQKILQKK